MLAPCISAPRTEPCGRVVVCSSQPAGASERGGWQSDEHGNRGEVVHHAGAAGCSKRVGCSWRVAAHRVGLEDGCADETGPGCCDQGWYPSRMAPWIRNAVTKTGPAATPQDSRPRFHLAGPFCALAGSTSQH